MSARHKRKRSLQDTPVDLTKMQLAKQRLEALQIELSGIEETTEEMEQIMTHVDALQDILGSSKKLKLGFSSVSRDHLLNLGVEGKDLVVKKDVLEQRLRSNTGCEHKIKLLCAQLKRIFRFVSMRFEPGARMIMDSLLLTVAEMSADGQAKLPVAILPEMRIATGDGVRVDNPETNFQFWLTGNVDYGLCTYRDESLRPRILRAAIQDVMGYARNRITLVEAKRDEGQQLYDNMPEAISQAIALSEVTKAKAVRFCLSDGRNWIFSLLSQDDQGNRVCYEGEVFTILEPREEVEEVFEHDVRKVVEMVYHWLVSSDDPLSDPLYNLEEKDPRPPPGAPA